MSINFNYWYLITKTWLAATSLGNGPGLAVSETQALSIQGKYRTHAGCRQVGDGSPHRSTSPQGQVWSNWAGCMAWEQPSYVSLSTEQLLHELVHPQGPTQHGLTFRFVVLCDILLSHWSIASNGNTDRSGSPMITKDSSHDHKRK